MANGDDGATKDTDYFMLVDNVLAAAGQHITSKHVTNAIAGGIVNAHGGVIAVAMEAASPIILKIGKLLAELEEVAGPVFAPFIAPILANMLGGEVDAAAFASKANSGARSAATKALVDTFMHALEGDAPDLARPGRDGAKRVAAAGLNAAVEGWFMGALTEVVSDCIPFDLGKITALTELPHEVVHALGVGRLVRRALAPLIDALAAEPMKWDVNKTYRPKLLAESTALRQYLRGRWAWEDAEEELARQGYTSERIDALLNELSKFLTPADLYDLERNGVWTHDQAIQHLRDAGYDEDRAQLALRLEGIHRIDSQNRELAAAAVDAYVRGGLDDGALDSFLNSFSMPATDVALYGELARAKRHLKLKPLSPAEAEACVKAGILAVPDYTAALLRDGYTVDAADALELLLRYTLDASKSKADHAAQQAAEKAAAAAQKQADAAAKKAEIDQARALKAQGSIAELEHAAITGLIPIARLEQVLAQQFTPDTVGIYVADVAQKRQMYLADQQKQADAATRAQNKGLPIATLEQAVFDNVIPLDKFGAMLKQQGISDADVQILVATATAKKADLDAAKKKRAEADLRASRKKIDLTRMEQLVARGLRTMADYDALLQQLGFDDASRAAMDQLLQVKVIAKAAAAGLRGTVNAANPTKGLTLQQFRQAVIRGEKTLDDFSAFLIADGYTADAQAVLIAELRDDVATADAARTRRAQGDATGGAVALSLSVAARAARLGIITPAAYQARLIAAGYSIDDVAIELDLLTAELAKTAGANQAIAGAAAPGGGKGLTLAQVGAAVKVGAATIGDYQAAAIASQLSSDAVATLVAAMQDELAAIADGKSRRAQILTALAAQNVSLTELEAPVIAGTLTVSAFEQQLAGDGYSDADAQLIGHLLEVQLEAAAPAPGG